MAAKPEITLTDGESRLRSRCMCRLFGMSGGPEPVRATFWLLQAPDSLQQQSRREPDGAGIGTFDAGGTADRRQAAARRLRGSPVRASRPGSWSRGRSSPTSAIAVQPASLTMANTHPFEQDGRLFAHNGVIGDVERLEAELGDARALVHGDTDSERFFALITREIRRRAGDVGEGIAAAARWVAGNLPVLSLNCVLITASDLWALRYPDTHELYVLERDAAPAGARHLRPHQRAEPRPRALRGAERAPGGRRRHRAHGRRSGLAGAALRRAAPRRRRAAGEQSPDDRRACRHTCSRWPISASARPRRRRDRAARR